LQALAEGSLTDAFEGLFEASERLPCGSRFERNSLPVILSSGLIGGICMPDGTRPHLLFSVGNNALGFCHAIFKNSLEMFDFARRRQAADLDTFGVLSYRVVGFKTTMGYPLDTHAVNLRASEDGAAD
jgi:hypothetical protein